MNELKKFKMPDNDLGFKVIHVKGNTVILEHENGRIIQIESGRITVLPFALGDEDEWLNHLDAASKIEYFHLRKSLLSR